jgi:hypothetical protein
MNTSSGKMLQLETGEIAATGSMNMGTPDNRDFFFFKIDQEGQEISRTHFGSDSYDIGESICPDFNGGYKVSGSLTYYCTPVVYGVDQNGTAGDYTAIADTVHSYGTMLKKAKSGYMMFLQGYSRLYFLKTDEQLNVKYMTWVDYHNTPVTFPPIYMQIQLMNDGSFVFMYTSDHGDALFKTKPI